MAKKMLINAIHPEEARVAIVEDGHLIELDIETAGKEQTRGNVYKGIVVRVEPGLQAAFVDIGMKKLGFLQMGEIHPDNWQWRDDIPEEQRNRRPRIQEILRRGKELIVQVEKGEREGKGAALTTFISLPGRYMVLMPGSDSCGISRKVESEATRKKLKETVAELGIPEGFGYIIRTEAVGRRKTELAKDFQYLMKLFNTIKGGSTQVKAPTLIYRESDLVIRTIRDYFTSDIEEVLVDNKDVYKQARAFFKEVMPKYEKIVKAHQEKRPIFAKYQLEEQIDLIYEKKVPLKSGGSIVIDPTEALVSIDVNSGKSTGEKGVEETAFKTNQEAAEEIARQLRLRDLGGLIVIDFIDMRDRKHKSEVEKKLKSALKADKARVSVDKISQFGLLEMSRQRIKQTLNEGSYLECPHCGGHGKVKSIEAMALSFLRKVHTAAARGNTAEVRGGLPLEVAYYLLNRKKQELAQIETEYDIEVTVKGKPSFMMNQREVELVRKEKPSHQETEHNHVTENETGETPETDTATAAEQHPAGEGEETKSKRKRRRSKKKPLPAPDVSTETEPVSQQAAMVTEEQEQQPAPPPEEIVETEASDETAEAESSAEAVKKKRRRRRKRPTKPADLETPTEATAAETTEATAPVVPEETKDPEPLKPQPEPQQETKPEQPREEKPEQQQEVPPKKPRKPRAPRKPRRAVPKETVPSATETTSDTVGKEEDPSRQPAETPEKVKPEQTVEKPKRKRAPRKKKEPVPEDTESTS